MMDIYFGNFLFLHVKKKKNGGSGDVYIGMCEKITLLKNFFSY